MKAIVNTAPGKLEMREVPIPEPQVGQVRIRTGFCGICTTDFKMIDGCARSNYPQILGHEWCGVVDKTGEKVDAAYRGRLCIGENVLERGGEVGFEHPGGYGGYFITEAGKLQFLPDYFSMEKAALAEPLAVCARALKKLRLENRSNALIFGDGTIGLIMLMMLRKEGVEKIGLVGGRECRLALARKLGAAFCVNYHDAGDDLTRMIKDVGGGTGYYNLVETSGSGGVMDVLFKQTVPLSRILLLGDYEEQRASFKYLDVIHRELEIIGSNASSGAWPEARRLLLSGELPLEELLTHTFNDEEFEPAMQTARSRESGAIKVLLRWQ